jgi:hypothetical protein
VVPLQVAVLGDGFRLFDVLVAAQVLALVFPLQPAVLLLLLFCWRFRFQ